MKKTRIELLSGAPPPPKKKTENNFLTADTRLQTNLSFMNP